MGYRRLYIKNADKICLVNDNICIKRKDREDLLFALEDIASLFLEDPNTVITSRLLTKLGEYNVSLILCNEAYIPTTQVLPFNTYYNQSNMLKKQICLKQFFKDRIWAKLVKAKIMNQARCIRFTTENEAVAKQLETIALGVKNGDPENKEGTAARLFFKEIYGDDFVRFGSNAISSALNYGYSILHGSIVRIMVSCGLNTNLGVWHDSSKNAYNLASDFIEPFRAIVDYYIYWHIDKIKIPLDKEIRKDLINLLDENIYIDAGTTKLETAIQTEVLSFIKCIDEDEINHLKIPELIEINFYD